MAKNETNVIALPETKKAQEAAAVAVQNVVKFYDRCKGPGGYEEIQKAEKAVRGELTGYVVAIAAAAVGLAGNDLTQGVAFFKSLCKRAEEALQAKYPDKDGKTQAITKLLPSWAPTKSSVLAGMEKKKINPAECKDGTEFMQKVRARAANKGADSARNDEPAASDFMTDHMAAAWDDLQKLVLDMSAKQQDTFAVTLAKLVRDTRKNIQKPAKGEEDVGATETRKTA